MRGLGRAGHEDDNDDWRLEGLVVVDTILVYMYVFCMYSRNLLLPRHGPSNHMSRFYGLQVFSAKILSAARSAAAMMTPEGLPVIMPGKIEASTTKRLSVYGVKVRN